MWYVEQICGQLPCDYKPGFIFERMRRILFCLIASCLLFASSDLHAQKRKKTSSGRVVKSSKKPAAKKKAAQSRARSRMPSTVAAVSGVGDFDRVNNLYGSRKELSQTVQHPEFLQSLDAFINSCIAQRVFPGCQIFAAKDGEIIYWKNFGHFTYDRSVPVTDSTLYDIASVTKVAATTLAVMKLYEEGKISLDAYLRKYLPFTEGTDKASLTVKDLLLHQAGLKAFIPFYKNTINKETGAPRTDLYRTYTDKIFALPVAPNFYLRASYLDTIWQEILNSPLENRGRYVYSDLDFYFLERIVESVAGMGLEQYVNEHFYKPLGLKFTMYNPWKKGWEPYCVPTENDDYFRFQLVKGYVHDPGTAMSGGVAGHAGIFSNARDVGIILQMLLNGGQYRDHVFFKKETVQLFTGYRSNISRRAFGFDKPDKASGDGGPASVRCSKTAFGHQGFTGTCAWADPETGITFVFLSNRVYPSAENSLINRLSVRSKAQTFIYQALGY